METFWTTERVAGSLLVGSFLLPLAALIFMLASGAAPGFSAALQGSLEQLAPYTSTMRMTNLLYAIHWIVQLMGLGLLTRLLLRAGDDYLAISAFAAVAITCLLGVLHGTFHGAVETWAAEEAVRTGSIPGGYQALAVWVDLFFRVAYVAHLIAMIGFGWAILRTGLLASWVGWVTLGWSALWLVGAFVGAGAPGIAVFMPVMIGMVLLVQ